MARYGSWGERPGEPMERGWHRERWRGGRDWEEEERRRAAERGEERWRPAERDEEWERGRGGEGWGPYRGAGPEESWGGSRWEERPPRAWRPAHRRELDPPWIEQGPRARGREDSRGLLEWEDRGPLEWLGDRARGAGRRARGPKGYVRSDERIREEVCERVARSGVDASEVEVEVRNREVTLSGTVPSRPEKWRLEEIVDDVFGVDDVHNNLRVSRAEAGAGRMGGGEPEGRGVEH